MTTRLPLSNSSHVARGSAGFRNHPNPDAVDESAGRIEDRPDLLTFLRIRRARGGRGSGSRSCWSGPGAGLWLWTSPPCSRLPACISVSEDVCPPLRGKRDPRPLGADAEILTRVFPAHRAHSRERCTRRRDGCRRMNAGLYRRSAWAALRNHLPGWQLHSAGGLRDGHGAVGSEGPAQRVRRLPPVGSN